MSDLLNQASLVMIPSGYKEDVVYSQIPISGAGDLSFTRASNGTRINSAGLVEVCPWNLSPYSEDFSNAAWLKTALTISANTAELVYPSSTGSNRIVENSYSVQNGIDYTCTWYAKAGGINWVGVHHIQGNIGAWFNLSNGTIGTISSGVTASIESVGNGWYRCIVTRTSTNTTGYMALNLCDGDNTINVTASGTNGVYLWGAQLNIGSTAKPYFPTTDRLNVPRLTYQNGGGGCPSLLLEKQSTNIALWSEQFDNANWIKNGTTVTANNRISPDGTQNADTVNFSGGGPIEQLIYYAADNLTHTVSVWAKVASGTQIFQLKITEAGVIDHYSGNFTATTEWQRFTFTQAFGSGGIGFYTGVNCSGGVLDLWGFQLEPNTSYVTSYILTQASSATRVADACLKTGISSLIGQTSGTMFIDTYVGNETDEVYGWLQASLSGNPNDSMQINRAGSSIQAQIYNGATPTGLITGGTISKGQRRKVAIGYANNDLVLYLNGTQIGVDTSTAIPTCAVFQLGAYPPLPNDYTNDGGINQAALFPTRLTNAELASLTSL
jgi:hypothetical protein